MEGWFIATPKVLDEILSDDLVDNTFDLLRVPLETWGSLWVFDAQNLRHQFLSRVLICFGHRSLLLTHFPYFKFSKCLDA